ncbi:putative outer membrane starch-binding protein [Mucilaginibacter frigoritolerans]|uniref:Putative outer membrane starch-binding protein n=1 Tax=Mucilaginibacter frigoritolerans TaxID=652788 RepID=A0A562U7A5_9SPHI|nr:RagB/SusD family nutrient uptake outer membrane protein [Mucilaginibacter frigoritolerans]TWJ01644.1 putative outer membrane starch-binding protein [Mucilaginibacter frigoritolerans]
MKINKIKFTIIAVFCAAMVIPLSCKKNFLTQTNTFNSTSQATFTTSQDVVALVNSIYDSYQNADLLKKSIWYYANFLSHDWYNDGADIAWNSYTINSNFAALSVFWNNAYIAIGRANAAFGIIATAKANGVVTAALADRLTGEAYFLRGMSYYYLAGTFGGVPLEIQEIPGNNGLTPRSTQDQVFAQVVADMKQAETLLLSKSTLPAADLGRATKGAAYGYEGAAQMWLKNYTAALAAFNNTELTSNYHLLQDFEQVNEFDHQNNDESLFEIQFDLVAGASASWDGGWQNGGEEAWIDDFSWPHEISGFGYDYGNPGLWYSYAAGDRRKTLTIIGPGDTIQSKGIIAKWGGIKGYAVVQAGFASGSQTYTGDDGKIINSCGSLKHPWYGDDLTRSGYYCAKKWRDPNLTGANGTSAIFGTQNQVLLRYAEIILDRAECKVRTGDIPGAMADLKIVRDRAWGLGLAGGSASPVDGAGNPIVQDGLTYDGKATQPITDPLQMVLSEYRHELTGDFSLFYNLRRAGPGVAAAFIHANYNTDNSLLPEPYPYGPTADGQLHGVWFTSLPTGHDILPIPQAAIGLNPNLKQNPGY